MPDATRPSTGTMSASLIAAVELAAPRLASHHAHRSPSTVLAQDCRCSALMRNGPVLAQRARGMACASTLTAIRVVAHRSAASGARPERWGRVSIGQNIPSRPFKTVPQGQVCGSTTVRARHVERVLHTCARCGMMPSSPGLGNSFVGTAVKNCLINVTSTPSGGSMRP